ncbi:MAG: response regulator [Anaerolineae bacterium]|nr:response regulator [Anaerolineae bacterium]
MSGDTQLSILIVDDEPDNLEVVFEILTFGGWTVKTAAHGGKALDILQTFTPDVILLDLSMPVMDGWETHKQLRTNPHYHHIPIIALTAHAMHGDEKQILAAGFDGYLAKPISVPTINADIQAIREKFQAATTESDAPNTASPAPDTQPDSTPTKG